MLSQVEKKAGVSHFWASLMGVEDEFWEDKWLGHQAFKPQYPNLYSVVRKKQATVGKVLQTAPLNVSF